MSIVYPHTCNCILIFTLYSFILQATVQMAGLTFVTVSANDMAVVNETVESDDQEESLEDVSNDTSGTNIPLKISLVSKLAFPDVMNMPLDDMIPPVGINLEDVPVTDLAQKFYDVAEGSVIVVDPVPMHIEMTLRPV